jgi:hypothetical protein
MRHPHVQLLALATLGSLSLTSAGCADQLFGPDGPTDPEPPVVEVTSPERAQMVGDLPMVTVMGRASDAETGLDRVTVNGVRAEVDGVGAFRVDVPVQPGINLLVVSAKDRGGNETTETRSVLTGPLSPLGRSVTDALATSVSDDALAAIAAGAQAFAQDGDLTAFMAGFGPAVDAGWSGPGDCLFGRVWVSSLDVDGAAVDLFPRRGALSLSAELTGIDATLHLEYAAACVDGMRDVTIHLDRLALSGDMAIGIAGQRLSVTLPNRNVTMTGLDLELGGVPGDVVNLLNLDSALGPVLGWVTERYLLPKVATALEGAASERQFTLAGHAVDLAMTPSVVAIDDAGVRLQMNAAVTVAGSERSPGIAVVRNSMPELATDDGFALAIADDFLNGLLAGAWAAGAMTYSLDLGGGDYGQIGVLFDGVDIEPLQAPMVSAHRGDGKVELIVPDLIATFRNGGEVVTKIAINGRLDLALAQAGDRLTLVVGTPAVDVDFLSDGVTGGNVFDDEQFEDLVSFAAERAVYAADGFLRKIPLPALGGVGPADLAVGASGGYVSADGRLTR